MTDQLHDAHVLEWVIGKVLQIEEEFWIRTLEDEDGEFGMEYWIEANRD